MSLVKALLMIVCVAQGAPAKESSASVFDSYLTPYVQTNNFSGSVLIEENGKVLFQKAYGFADREKKVSNRATTRFHIASVSMQFTATAILRLVDQGAITLNTHVSEVIPGFAGGEKVSIRDLLMERSGLPDINDLPEYAQILQSHQTPASLVERVSGKPLLFEPGTKFLHEEHSAYNLLALIIEKKTGMPFARAMEKLVFKPARLSNSSVDDDGPIPDSAKGYQPRGTEELEPATEIHWSAKSGNGSVVTTVGNEVRFVHVLFEKDLLKPGSQEAILDTSERVGYGWFRSMNRRFHETAYSMNGRAPGFASFVLYLPKEKLTVVAFSNIYSSATTTIGNDLAAIALGLPYEGFHPAEKALSAEQIRVSTGEFQFGEDFYQKNAKLVLQAEDSELSLRWPSGDISPLISVGADSFIDRAYWEEVRIERGPDGLPKALVYDRFRGNSVPRK
ncbi:MAG TPA: serine hydrolase domain-containing protein [Terriglobales bacterium]|nr:serine hydrolase domain-containing protein [Terriglobales bacterium]